MVDLVQWLTAQLDTDAEANASPYAEGAWHTRGCASIPDVFGQETSACDCGVPARVLREINAKRDLLRFAEGVHDHHETFTTGVAARLEQTLRLFALAYADRPGFREEWAL